MARLISDRFVVLETALANLVAVERRRLTLDERDHQVGVIRGEVVFIDGSIFRLLEYLDQAVAEPRRRYAYEYRRVPGGPLVWRYDNVTHPQLSERLLSFPHHVHRADGSIASSEPPEAEDLLERVRREICPDRQPQVAPRRAPVRPLRVVRATAGGRRG